MADDPDPEHRDEAVPTEEWPPWLRPGAVMPPELVLAELVLAEVVPPEAPSALAAEPEDGEEEQEEADEGDEGAEAGMLAPPWPARAEIVGWGLVAMVVVLIFGTLLIALAASSRQGSLWARLGAAFFSQAGPAYGLALLVAAGLACWARAERLLTACLVAAVGVCAAAPLAMLGDVANLRHTRQVIDALVRWELLTWFGVTFIPAALAAMVAWWGRIDRLGSPRA